MLPRTAGAKPSVNAAKYADGLVVVHSRRTVAEVIERLRQMMLTRNLKIFADVNFSADAAAEGLQLRPTRMLITGSPQAGTPLIEAVPTIAIDLPLKVLVWSPETGLTCVAYNEPQYLGHRHGVPQELVRNIAGFGLLVEKAAGEAP
jgi:uncharacterized protein (DUF302 family)